MNGPVLQAREVRKAYGRHTVLQGISFALAPGTLAGIVGENGAGKSTLLRILAGELAPTAARSRCAARWDIVPNA